jgi:TonB family protein
MFALVLACGVVAGPVAAGVPQAAKGKVYKPGDGVSAPVVVKQVKPRYTDEAMKAKIQGTVLLECVVDVDGTVGEIKVTRALDPGLDEAAITALRQWQFEPGKKDGQPVRVRVETEMTFSLK